MEIGERIYDCELRCNEDAEENGNSGKTVPDYMRLY